MRRLGHLDASAPLIHRPHFLDHAMLSPARCRIGHVSSPSPPLCQRTFGGVELRRLLAGRCLWFPCEGAEMIDKKQAQE